MAPGRALLRGDSRQSPRVFPDNPRLFLSPPSSAGRQSSNSTGRDRSDHRVSLRDDRRPAHRPAATDLDAATFASIGCRLHGLLVRIAGETSLGDYGQKLPPPLAGAAARLDEAAQSCGAGDAKRASKKIKQAAHRLVQYAHGLNGRRAHRRLPTALREELVTRGNDIRAAVTILRKTVHCPEDAPARRSK